MNLAFHLAVAPRQDDRGVDRLFVAAKPITETHNFRQPCSSCLIKPCLSGVTLLAAEHCGEVLCQLVEYGDFRAALVQFGEQLLFVGFQLFWSPGQ
jgi:hypothetical protein